MHRRFDDRREAGRLLAARLLHYADQPDVIVLALPRGGVPVGYEVAQTLHAPLDVFVVRKIGVPDQPELAMGAIASGGIEVVNDETVDALGIDEATFRAVAAQEGLELRRREEAYRNGREPLEVSGKTVILADDGLATGASMRSAVLAVRQRNPRRIVVAVPVGAMATCDYLRKFADELVCLRMPEPFHAIGLWYEDFSQTTDDQVHGMLHSAGSPPPVAGPPAVQEDAADSAGDPPPPQPVRIPVENATIDGDLCLPSSTLGIVLFAHGSGSSRHSPRNRHVAVQLQRLGLGTLLMDLLTPQEEALDDRTARLRFDIPLLAARLVAATDWLCSSARAGHLRIGYFGASTGAAAALVAAAQRPAVVAAVVSRGGRPDLAGDALRLVKAPTLLIVGGADTPVIEMNRTAAAQLCAPHTIEIIPGATHLFEEPGALDEVARLAGQWYTRYLARPESLGSPRQR